MTNGAATPDTNQAAGQPRACGAWDGSPARPPFQTGLFMSKGFKRKKLSQAEAQKDRLHLLLSNLERLPPAWKKAAEAGLSNEVMLVVDARDGFGAAFLKARGTAWTREHAEAAVAEKKIPTLFIGMSSSDASRAFAELTPSVSKRLKSPPPQGNGWVAVIAKAGTTLAALPQKFMEGQMSVDEVLTMFEGQGS